MAGQPALRPAIQFTTLPDQDPPAKYFTASL